MPGPPPKLNPHRRGKTDTLATALVLLPASGRSDPAPAWPLAGPTEPELEVWAGLWVLPQAVAWERQESTRSVARYVRALVRAEEPDAPAAILAEVRQMEDRLGLTPMAMLRLRWAISDEDEPVEAQVLEVVPDRWRGAG